MARPLRIDFAGALYHVMSRGVDRRRIFADGRDFDRRVAWICRAVRTFGWKLHAFVLLPNHDHLFLETTDANLSASMQFLNSGYAGYYNHRHDRCGHLFQGRFKAHLIETDGHYREVSRYIHLNPVRAGLATLPEDWRWSSYAGYADPSLSLGWVTYERVLREFGEPGREARANYRAFVAAGMNGQLEPPWRRAEAGLLVGSPEFIARMRASVASRPPDPAVPQLAALRPRPSLGKILVAVQMVRRAADGAPLQPRWETADVRAITAFLARRRLGYKASEVARAIGFAEVALFAT